MITTCNRRVQLNLSMLPDKQKFSSQVKPAARSNVTKTVKPKHKENTQKQHEHISFPVVHKLLRAPEEECNDTRL